MRSGSLQTHILTHIPDDGAWVSTGRIHDLAFPGQRNAALKKGRARTYRILRGMAHDGHLIVDQVDDRHARWSRPT